MTDHLHALPEGYELEGYRIERVLGVGGFGITYLAQDISIGKSVAIKEYLPNEFALRADGATVLPKSSSDKDDFDWGLERFLDEAKTLATFDHPNLNTVFRFFEANGTAYMVLEYIEGETLSARLKRDKTIPETGLKVLLEAILSGLTVVHEAGFVHRDIKPGNIMLKPDGMPVLLDFGAARAAIGQRSKSITSILTPGYAPIEQYDPKGEDVGPWTDIYALGMVAYRCVVGCTDGELVDAVTRSRVVRKQQFDQDLKPAVQAAGQEQYATSLLSAIDAAIRVDEDDRPASVVVWRELLFESEVVSSVPDTHTAGRKQASPTVSRKTLVVGSLGLVVAVVLARWISSTPEQEQESEAPLVVHVQPEIVVPAAPIPVPDKPEVEVVPQPVLKAETYPLTIITNPADARVRILNIGPRYSEGIALAPGKYHIEVSKSGYEKQRQWVTLDSSSLEKTVVLSKSKEPVVEQDTGPSIDETITFLNERMRTNPEVQKNSTGPVRTIYSRITLDRSSDILKIRTNIHRDEHTNPKGTMYYSPWSGYTTTEIYLHHIVNGEVWLYSHKVGIINSKKSIMKRIKRFPESWRTFRFSSGQTHRTPTSAHNSEELVSQADLSYNKNDPLLSEKIDKAMHHLMAKLRKLKLNKTSSPF